MWMSVAHRSAVVAVAACSALALVSCGGGGGETRRFDQYPTLLGIEGSGVVVAGEEARMLVVADTDFTWNDGLSLDETLGVDQSAAVAVSPARATLTRHGDSYTASAKLTAPQVGSVTRLEIKARNPRTEVARDIYVVPAGTLYVKSLTVAGNLLVGGNRMQATLELSDLVAPGADVEVALAASSALLDLPAKVVVAAQSKTAVFAISAAPLQGETYVRLSATLNGATQSIGLWLRSAEPFLRHLAVPSNIATDPARPMSAEGIATLSVPLTVDATLRLSSNNNLVGVPATVRAEAGQQQVIFAIDSQPFGGSSAVRFTATLGNLQKVADASVGFRAGDARLERMVVNGESNFFRRPLIGSCAFPLLVDPPHLIDSRIAFVDLTLSAPAPADARIEVYSSKRLAADAFTEVTVPAGQTRLSLLLAVDPGALLGDRLRYLRLNARVKSTGQQLSEPIFAYTRDGLDNISVIDSVGPVDPATVHLGGTSARFQVNLNFPHPFDDVPFRLSLHERSNGNELAYIDSVVFAGQWSRVLSLLMPAVGQTTAVELRATLGSPRSDGGWCVSPDRVPAFAFDLQVAPAGLSEISPTTAGLFPGQSTDITVRLSQAAGSDTRVAITSSLAAGVLSGVPAELLIPAGRTAAAFTVNAAASVTAVHSGMLNARLDGNTQTAALHVLPEPASLQLALTPANASAGQPVTLQVQVTPNYPIAMPVSLSSDRPALPVPPVLAIAANAGVATATLSVAPVAQPEVVTVTARLRGLSTSQSMAVSPTQPPPGGAAWQALSPARLAASSAGDIPSVLALDANGRAYISYLLTVGEQQRIIVQREGTTFAMLGTALNGISNWSATSQDMAVAANAQPVLAYGIDSQAIAVAQWNDDERQWDSLIARANLGPADGSSPQLAMSGGVANQQTIVLAWVENERIAVRRYSMATRTWDAGALLPGIDRVRTIRMMLHASGAPVIAYWTGSLHVVREDATGAWVPLGGAINSQPTDHNGVASFGVHVDSGGTVHVAWVEGISSSGGTPWAISASRFDGSSWVPAAQNSSLVFDAGASNVRRFPSALVVARRPDVFAFATSWDVFGSDLSELHVTKLSNQGQWSVSQVPIGQDGQYRSARHVSLAMRDAEHPLITSSHYDASASLSYVLLGRRFVP